MSAVTHGPLSPSSVLPSTESEENSSVSCLHHLFSAFADDCQTQDSLFPNAQNILITGGTFFVCLPFQCTNNLAIIVYFIYQNNVNNINIFPLNTREGQMKISVPQKPNASPMFTGQKDVLDKLRKIFVQCTDSKLMSRHSCLLWGTGGIGKTQICLKFIEEISDR